MHPTECCNGSISRLEHQTQNTFHLHEYNLLVYAARTFKTVSLALCEHSKRDPVGPEATPTVSTGLAVDAKLTLLTDSIGLVCLADDKVALLTPKEGSETTALKAKEELLTADVPAITQPTESSRSVVTGEKHIESHPASRGLTRPDPEILVRPSGKTNKDNETCDCLQTQPPQRSYMFSISSARRLYVNSDVPVTPCHKREHLQHDWVILESILPGWKAPKWVDCELHDLHSVTLCLPDDWYKNGHSVVRTHQDMLLSENSLKMQKGKEHCCQFQNIYVSCAENPSPGAIHSPPVPWSGSNAAWKNFVCKCLCLTWNVNYCLSHAGVNRRSTVKLYAVPSWRVVKSHWFVVIDLQWFNWLSVKQPTVDMCGSTLP